ncbi:hypothetical protein MZK49_23760 [Ensifer sesbaniae]|nr:hypothetical protein [Ensifer sesbaniae]
MLICLHGCGGTPADWGRFPGHVAPTMEIHCLQGDISVNGGYTFFAKRADGGLDPEEMASRADRLVTDIAALQRCASDQAHIGRGNSLNCRMSSSSNRARSSRHAAGCSPAPPLLMGYSSGATIAAAVLQRHPAAIAGAVLLRPQPPFLDPPCLALSGLPVLVLAGRHDTRRTPDAAETLALQLRSAGAEVELHLLNTGHGWDPTGRDGALAKAWFNRFG